MAVNTARCRGHDGGRMVSVALAVGGELCDGCPSFLFCKARISWDSCSSDPDEGEGRVPPYWSPV